MYSKNALFALWVDSKFFREKFGKVEVTGKNARIKIG